jgi:hypothetical protein
MNEGFVATEEVLERVPFARSRFMAIIGGAVAGTGLRLFAPAEALAFTPPPCVDFPQCQCCNNGNYPGTHCCDSGCYYSSWMGCSSGGQCWIGCYNHVNYRCCDWYSPVVGGGGGGCVCRGYVGGSC